MIKWLKGSERLSSVGIWKVTFQVEGNVNAKALMQESAQYVGEICWRNCKKASMTRTER